MFGHVPKETSEELLGNVFQILIKVLQQSKGSFNSLCFIHYTAKHVYDSVL